LEKHTENTGRGSAVIAAATDGGVVAANAERGLSGDLAEVDVFSITATCGL